MASKEFRNDPRRARLEAASKIVEPSRPVTVVKPTTEPEVKPSTETAAKKTEKKN